MSSSNRTQRALRESGAPIRCLCLKDSIDVCHYSLLMTILRLSKMCCPNRIVNLGSQDVKYSEVLLIEFRNCKVSGSTCSIKEFSVVFQVSKIRLVWFAKSPCKAVQPSIKTLRVWDHQTEHSSDLKLLS